MGAGGRGQIQRETGLAKTLTFWKLATTINFRQCGIVYPEKPFGLALQSHRHSAMGTLQRLLKYGSLQNVSVYASDIWIQVETTVGHGRRAVYNLNASK